MAAGGQISPNALDLFRPPKLSGRKTRRTPAVLFVFTGEPPLCGKSNRYFQMEGCPHKADGRFLAGNGPRGFWQSAPIFFGEVIGKGFSYGSRRFAVTDR